MSKRLEMGNLLSDLRYQVQPVVGTWGACSRCGSPSRGCRACAECLKDDIADLLGDSVPQESLMFLVNSLCEHFRIYRDIEERLLSVAERKDSRDACDELTRLGQEMGDYG